MAASNSFQDLDFSSDFQVPGLDGNVWKQTISDVGGSYAEYLKLENTCRMTYVT